LKNRLIVLCALGYCSAAVGAQAPTGVAGSSAPVVDQGPLTPQKIVASMKRQLPIELGDGVTISQAEIRNETAVELNLDVAFMPHYLKGKKAEQVSAYMAAKAGVTALCGTSAIKTRYLNNKQVIYLNIPSAKDGPATYKISGVTCSKSLLIPARIARPMPELPAPADINYSGKHPSASFNSCSDWESRISVVKPNNTWLLNYSWKPLVKGEFETTEAFNIRQSSQKNAFVNLAIPIDPEGLKYNADDAIMRVNLRDTATLHRELEISDTYVGTNAFGASIEVERSREKVTAVEFQNPAAVFPSDRYIPMTVEMAKSVKARGVIRVLGAVMKHSETYTRYREPSLDDPRDQAARYNSYLVEPYCVYVMVDGKKIADWQEF